MNIFLTGNIQVGKSTAIKKFLKKEKIKPLGFTTHLDRNTGSLMMKVSGNDGEYDFQVAAPGKSHRPVPDTDAFDRAGRLLMYIDTKRCKLLIMDELGFLEKDASVFLAAVPALLDRGVNTIGVLRNKPDGPFWDMLHSRKDTVILTVDEENRNTIPDMISRYMSA